MIDREKLKDLFVAMSDRTRPVDAVTFKIYCDYFDEEELSTETVVNGMTHLVATWEHYWWPSAEVIANTSRRIRAESFPAVAVSVVPTPVRRDTAEDRTERIALAKEWAKVNPDRAEALRRKVTKEFRARGTAGKQLTPLSKMWRDEAILAALVNAARGVKEEEEEVPPEPEAVARSAP